MKTTLITGTNRGIGLEFSRQYAADGWSVLACSRNPGKSDELNKLAAQYPELIKILALDVSDHAQIERLAQELSDESIDLLISNAGIYPKSDVNSFGHIDYAEWMQVFRINTMAPLKMAETFHSTRWSREKNFCIAITSKMGSIADNSGGRNYLYRSSKTAVNMVVKSLAIDLQSAGITSIVIHPGWVKTDMGGPNALISTEQSVSGMRQVISNLSMADSGKFFSYDGQEIPW